MSDDWLRTSVGTCDADSITVMGRDVADELMGQVTLTELAFLLVRRGRRSRRRRGCSTPCSSRSPTTA